METRAVAKFVRISPRKIRLVMDQVRGKQVGDALNMLSFAPQRGARILKKLVNSAIGQLHEMGHFVINSDKTHLINSWKAVVEKE